MFARLRRGGQDAFAVDILPGSHLPSGLVPVEVLGRLFWFGDAGENEQAIRRRRRAQALIPRGRLPDGASSPGPDLLHRPGDQPVDGGRTHRAGPPGWRAWQRGVAGLSIQPERRGLLGSGRSMPAFRPDDRHALARTSRRRRDAAHRSDDRAGSSTRCSPPRRGSRRFALAAWLTASRPCKPDRRARSALRLAPASEPRLDSKLGRFKAPAHSKPRPVQSPGLKASAGCAGAGRAGTPRRSAPAPPRSIAGLRRPRSPRHAGRWKPWGW